MHISVITCCCKVVVGPGVQFCTRLEVWVLGVGMSTLGVQTAVCRGIGFRDSIRWIVIIVSVIFSNFVSDILIK
jgi:hypothetical protein